MHLCKLPKSSATTAMPLTLAGRPLLHRSSQCDAASRFVPCRSQKADDGISEVGLASQRGPTRITTTHAKCGNQCGITFSETPLYRVKTTR
jgi:hypothetical protein